MVGARSEKKVAYFERLRNLVDNYQKILIVHANHVGSRQMAEVRLALRGKAFILMGKNTMIRTCLRSMEDEHPQIKELLPLVRDNIGLVFCINDAAEVRKIIISNKVPAPAKQGAIAPCDVVVQSGPTGLDPSQTNFFQALSVSTKIVKAQIEIQSSVNLIRKGDKVTAGQSALLQKLNIKPFSYGLEVLSIYDDGSVYDSSVLDITDEDIIAKFKSATQNVAAFSREVGLPNQVSAVHILMEGIKNCMAAVLESDFTFPEVEPVKAALA